MDTCSLLNDVANVTSHGGADSQIPVDVLVDGIFIGDADSEDRACFALYDDATITSHGGPDAPPAAAVDAGGGDGL